MTQRRWFSLGASLIFLLGIAIYFVGFYPTSAGRMFEEGLAYVEEESDEIFYVYEPEGHEPSIYFYEKDQNITLMEAFPGENMIQSDVERENVAEGISVVVLTGMERHSAILIERDDAQEIETASLSKAGEVVVDFEINYEDGHAVGFMKKSSAINDVDKLTLTKTDGEAEELDIKL